MRNGTDASKVYAQKHCNLPSIFPQRGMFTPFQPYWLWQSRASQGQWRIIHKLNIRHAFVACFLCLCNGTDSKQRDKKYMSFIENVWKYGQTPCYIILIQCFVIKLVYKLFDNIYILYRGKIGFKTVTLAEGHGVFCYLTALKA